MGWGWGWAVLWGLLGTAVPALRCPLCDVTGCRPALCPSPRAVCRRTTLTSLRDGLELRREESGCDVTGPPDVVITFRSRGELVTLREERWGAGPGGSHAHGHAPPAPPANGSGPAPRLCPTCDGSCPSPLPALPCPRPQDRCLDVISRGPDGEGEGQRLRGCGQAGPCRGLLAFDSGRGRGAALQCCERAQCELEPGPPSGLQCWGYDGPAPSAGPAPSGGPAPLRCGWGRGRCFTAWGRGPAGSPWLLRGCASPEWCRSPVGLGGIYGASVGLGDPMGDSMGESMGDPIGDSMGQGGSMGDSMGQGRSMGPVGSMGDSMGESMGLGGKWGRSMGQGDPMGDPMGDRIGESMGPGDSIGDSMGQEDPIDDSMGPGGPMGDSMGLRCCRGHFCNALPGDPSPPPPSAAPPPLGPLPPLLFLPLPLLLLLAAPQV